MTATELDTIARGMVAKDKGILAADESTGTIKKRFDKIKLESTEESRRAYRELLFTTPGASDYISAVIFYDETLRQKTKDGVAFPEYLTRIGIIPGIKVDTGAKPLATASSSTTSWAPASPSGARSSTSLTGSPRRLASTPTRTPSGATRRCARSRRSSRSSSPKC
jgi:hypothetical protein